MGLPSSTMSTGRPSASTRANRSRRSDSLGWGVLPAEEPSRSSSDRVRWSSTSVWRPDSSATRRVFLARSGSLSMIIRPAPTPRVIMLIPWATTSFSSRAMRARLSANWARTSASC